MLAPQERVLGVEVPPGSLSDVELEEEVQVVLWEKSSLGATETNHLRKSHSLLLCHVLLWLL